MSESLVLVGIVIVASSGLFGLVGRTSMIGQWVTTLLAVVGSGFGLAGVGRFWANGAGQPMALPWSIQGAGFTVSIDGISAIFLVPIFLISMLGGVYGLGYWKQSEHPENGRKLRFFYGMMTAGMALLVIARNSIVLLFGWEIMALSAFFLVTTEDESREVRDAGWIYLLATHAATLCLFALFALLRVAVGSFELVPLAPGSLTPTMGTAVFLLALVGFGVKAGIMPLHVWLPGAHAMAPSHVSAVMSGVLIKMGIYGLIRVTSLIPDPPLGWGVTLLVLGSISGVVGVLYAIGQHDLKRLLAYHSIENIGIIVIGLGLAMIGRSTHREDWVALGIAGAFLHVWNHALFKALLFLERRVGHPRHAHPRDRPPGRPVEGDAADLVLLPGRGGRDLRAPALERVRQRVPDLPRPVPDAGRGAGAFDRHGLLRGPGAGPDRGAGGGLLREGVRGGLPRLGPVGPCQARP